MGDLIRPESLSLPELFSLLSAKLDTPPAKMVFRANVHFVLRNVETDEVVVSSVSNLITDVGDQHMAQRFCQESTTHAFGILELGTAGTAPAKGSARSAITALVANSQKAHDSGYPRTGDPDPENPDAPIPINMVTYRTSYATTEANATDIDRGIITNVTPAANEPVFNYSVLAPTITKTTSFTLKVFTNITMVGV